MLSAEEKLKRAAIRFGEWRERAHKSQTMPDRIKFVRAEVALGEAAQAVFEKEKRREKRRRNKG